MLMKENELRDVLFKTYKKNLSSIIQTPNPVQPLLGGTFPSIATILQHRTESRINSMLDRLEFLQLDGKEVRLTRDDDTTTRIDLLGSIAESGDLVLIELKKSNKTEREAFTELLAYSNHFCTLFPPLTESSLQTVLIAPMAGRGVRDAYAQELILNDKKIVALIPQIEGTKIKLKPYYPDSLYYRWIENSILSDSSMTVVTASFPLIEGWIDAGEDEPPEYTQQAFKILSGIISQRLEAEGLHGFVYARQLWSELCSFFPNPNTIILCVVNPFDPIRTSCQNGEVFGNSNKERLVAVQAVVDQISENEFWLENLHSAFLGQIIRIMQESFDVFFASTDGVQLYPEISTPDWGCFKESLVEAATCHNMGIRLSGLLRTIYTEYLEHCYANKYDEIFFSDDLPKYGYIAYDHFLAVWEILKGLSEAEDL